MNLTPGLSQSLSIAREHRRGVWWLLAGLITGAGLIVRTYQLGAAGLWFDEAFSYDAASADPSTILRASANTGYPPLYYLFLHSWMSLFGTNEAILRVPSLLAGTILVAAVLGVGSDMFGQRVGLLAGGLVALTPMLVHFSQEARVYSFMGLLALLATWCLYRAVEQSHRAWWIGYVLLLIGLLYSHYIAVLLLAAHALILIGYTWRQRRPHLLVPFAAAIGASLFAFVPWLPFFLTGPHAVALKVQPSVQGYWTFLVSITGNEVHVGGHGLRDLLAGGTAILLGALVLWAGYLARGTFRIHLMLATCALPLLLLAPVSGYFGMARHLSYMLPLFWMLVAWAVIARQVWWQRSLVVALVLLVFGINLSNLYQGKFDVNEHWRDVYTALNGADPDTRILVYPGYYIVTADYYYHGRAPIQALPHTLDMGSLSFNSAQVQLNPADLAHYDTALLSQHHVVIVGAFVGYDYSPITTWLLAQGFHETPNTPLMQRFYNAGIIDEFQR